MSEAVMSQTGMPAAGQTPDAAALRDACERVAGAASNAVAWVSDARNTGVVGLAEADLSRYLRRATTEARKLGAAVDRPMCVGVFGPSQAGKSYLVGALAKPEGGPLEAVFDGAGRVNFLGKINPEGNRESTGIVTRFSLRTMPHPDGFPVGLRLLTQLDLIKILGNTAMFDGDPAAEAPLTPETVSEALTAARAAASPQALGELSEEDVWDLQDYFEKQFAAHRGRLPDGLYWREAEDLLPRLSLPDRAAFLSLLWGRHGAFTALYRELSAALAELGNAATAFATLDALLPRETSIIDVATLAKIGTSEAAEDRLSVSAGGRTVALPRAILTALIAELHITMAEQPHEFFETTDLLDFPGARSREPLDLGRYLEGSTGENPLKETFLRGKVAYLFDRYVAEQELTAMLLCIRDSNQDVTTLPALIQDWITTTHGETPAERASVPTSLFFVLTMFDKHFESKAGDDEENLGSRFDSRLFSSLTGFFGKAYDWPHEWHPEHAFSNTFWLRNPSFKAEFMIRYDSDDREVEILPEKRERIEALRQAYLAEPKVRAHIAGPARAWEAALTLNDGGVAYLTEQLTPLCAPRIKQAQIASRLGALRRGIGERLGPFYVSSDVDKRLQERRAVASDVLESVYALRERRKFGSFLRALQVPVADLTDHVRQVQAQPLAPPSDRATAPVSPAAAASPSLPRPGGLPMPGRPPASATTSAIPASTDDALLADGTVSREARAADAMIGFWIDALRRNARTEPLMRTIGIDAHLMGEVVTELTAGARRLDLRTRLAQRLARFDFVERPEEIAAKYALAGWRMLSDFSGDLGQRDVPPGERAQVETAEGARPVFAARNQDESQGTTAWTRDAFAEPPRAYADDRLVDWAFSFYRLVEDNAVSVDGQDVDWEQNAKVGAILADVTAEAA